MKEEKQIEDLKKRVEELEKIVNVPKPKYEDIQTLRRDAKAFYDK